MTDSGFTHEAFLYADEERLCAAALPFLRDGVAAGELVCVITDHNELLRQALGADARHVTFVDAGEWFARPGTAFAAYQRFIDENLAPFGRRARVLAEAVWADRSRAEVSEWQRLEAAVNVAFADAPLHVACCYDQRRAPTDLQNATSHTHQSIHDGNGRQAMADLAPERFIDHLERDADLPAPPVHAVAMTIDGNLGELRGFVRDAAAHIPGLADRVDDAVLVVNELATNLLRYSAGQGELLAWSGSGQLICELRDPTGNRPPPLAGFLRPDPQQPGGFGLAIARQLADLVNVAHDEQGTAVRATFTAH